MASGSVVGLTAKLGLDTDDRQIDSEVSSLKDKISNAAEMEMETDVSTLKRDISIAVEDAMAESKFIPDVASPDPPDNVFESESRFSQSMEMIGQDPMPGRGTGSANRSAGLGAEAFAGMKGAGGKFLKVGLAGAVGFGILSKITSLSDSAPRMQKNLSMMRRTIALFARPFFDWLARWGDEGVVDLLQMAASFNEIYADEGIGKALKKLPEIFITEDGETSEAESGGRLVGGLAGLLGGAYGGAKLGGAAGATLGSIIPGAGTAIGGTGGAILGGAVGGLAGLVGGAEIGEKIASKLAKKFNWPDWINPLNWDSIIDALKWTAFINPLTWPAAIAAFGWDEFVDEVGLPDYVSPLNWGTYIDGILDFGDYLTHMTWNDFVDDFDWGNWVSVLNWNVSGFSWNDFISVVDWNLPSFPGWSDLVDIGTGGGGDTSTTPDTSRPRGNDSGASPHAGRARGEASEGSGGGGDDIGEEGPSGFYGDTGGASGSTNEGPSGFYGDTMARGGILTRDTVVAGEAGAEVIAPFSKFMNAMNGPRSRFGEPRAGGSTGGSGGAAGASGADMSEVVDGLRRIERQLKRLDLKVELGADLKQIAKTTQKSQDRYANSRVVSK